MLIFVALGFISALFQLTVFREFTYSLAKNEFGLILAAGVWLISCSLGSFFFKGKKTFNPKVVPLLLASVYSLSICAIHLFKLLAGLSYYETASLGLIFSAAILLISPVGFLIGGSFRSFTLSYLSEHSPRNTTFGDFFAYEAAGFFSGAAAFTFLFSANPNPFIFSIFALLLLAVLKAKAVVRITYSALIILLTAAFAFSFPTILKLELKGADILAVRGTNYGPVIRAKKFGVESLYLNGSLAATSEDKAVDEQFIHTSFSAYPEACDILFVGPYFPGQLREILKYPINSLVCLDMNPLLPSLSADELTLARKKKVEFVVADPRSHLTRSGKSYDYIIMNIAAPSSVAFNRYFSYQFFSLVEKRLNDRGVFSFRIPSQADILTPRFVQFNSCVINTLDKVFKSRLLIPLDSMIVIAAKDREINPGDLLLNFKSFNRPTDYFTLYHLRDSIDLGRIDYLKRSLDPDVGINSDFNLLGFLYHSLIEQAKFYPRFLVDIAAVRSSAVILFIILSFILSGYAILKHRSVILLNASLVGFLSIGLSAVIFLLFQLYSGALFWKIGILSGTFMAGLSAGAFLTGRFIEKLFKVKKTLTFFYLLWFMLLLGVWATAALFGGSVFYLWSFLSGLLTGSQYPIVSRLIIRPPKSIFSGINGNPPCSKNIAPAIYAADLAGASAGTIGFSIIFIPFLGIGISLLLLMFLVFVWGVSSYNLYN